MKLALAEQEGICILTSTGEISKHDVQVIKAGLTKLFKSGKNRIIIDLPEAEKLLPEMLREISMMDALARELSGKIVLAGISARLREQIAQFANPPMIDCLESRQAALQKLKTEVQPTAETPPDPRSGVLPAEPDEKVKLEKAALREKELKESTDIRKQNAQLLEQNRLLTEQLLVALAARKETSTEASHRSQVEALEQRIQELLKAAPVSTKAK